MNLSADPNQVAEIRLLLAAQGGVRPDAVTLGLLMGKIQRAALTHGATCYDPACPTCAEFVSLLSVSTAFVVDNIPSMEQIIERTRREEELPLPAQDEIIEQTQRGDIPTAPSRDTLIADLTGRLDANERRFFQTTGVVLATGGTLCGAIIGWFAARNSNSPMTYLMGAFSIAMPVICYRLIRRTGTQPLGKPGRLSA